jgi:hypothetical protein
MLVPRRLGTPSLDTLELNFITPPKHLEIQKKIALIYIGVVWFFLFKGILIPIMILCIYIGYLGVGWRPILTIFKPFDFGINTFCQS